MPAQSDARALSRDVFARWLHRCRQTLFAHGSDLVEELGKNGDPDNVAGADRLLDAAVAAGQIRRCETPTPTRSQSFMGSSCSVPYGYEPVSRADGLDRIAALTSVVERQERAVEALVRQVATLTGTVRTLTENAAGITPSATPPTKPRKKRDPIVDAKDGLTP